jgi:hypothetical protein
MKMKINAFLHYHKSDWSNVATYRLHWSDVTGVLGPEYVMIREQEFEVEIPDDFDPRPIQIATLRAEREKIVAECEAKKQNLDEQIMRLLAIENTVPA